MGISPSLLGKLGVPGVESIAQDQVYDKYFSKRVIQNFGDFHVAFVNLCNEMNTILPGKHYKAPDSESEELKNFFKDWITKKDKQGLIEFIKKNIKEHKPSERAMIVTGMVAPTAATLIKKTGQNAPQLKKFRLHLIPNFVFVPAVTLVALVGVRGFQIRSTTRS